VRPIDVPIGISIPSNFERPVAMLLSKVSTELPFESGELLEAGEYKGKKAYVQQLRDPVSHLLYDADGRALFAAFLMMDVSGEFF